MTSKRPKKSQGSDERPPQMSIRDEQKRITYERLLNAAKDLFESSGVEDVTIDQIARRAGTNRTTFYLHFEDKAQIAFKIRTRYMQMDMNHIQRYLGQKRGATRDDIRRWIRTRGNTFRKLKTVIEIGSESLHRKPELMREFLDQTHEILNAGFQGFLERFPPPEREKLEAELLFGAVMLNRYLYITVIQGLRFPVKSILEVLVDYWFKLLNRKPAGA